MFREESEMRSWKGTEGHRILKNDGASQKGRENNQSLWVTAETFNSIAKEMGNMEQI